MVFTDIIPVIQCLPIICNTSDLGSGIHLFIVKTDWLMIFDFIKDSNVLQRRQTISGFDSDFLFYWHLLYGFKTIFNKTII